MRPFARFPKTLLWGAILIGLTAFGTLALSRPQTGWSAVLSASASAASNSTSVFLTQPTQAVVGERLIVKLVANNAKDLAGFQATIAFDPNVVHLTGATVSDELSRTGRGLLPLGPVIGYDTATIGAATCAVVACDNLAEARVAQRQTQGVYGRVELAQLELVIVALGSHTLTLSDVQLVAPDGALLDVATTASLSLTAVNP